METTSTKAINLFNLYLVVRICPSINIPLLFVVVTVFVTCRTVPQRRSTALGRLMGLCFASLTAFFFLKLINLRHSVVVAAVKKSIDKSKIESSMFDGCQQQVSCYFCFFVFKSVVAKVNSTIFEQVFDLLDKNFYAKFITK